MTPFTIEHRFAGARLLDVERMYMLDDEFNEATFRELGFDRKVVAREAHGSGIERVLKLCPLQALPKPFASLVPSDTFYIEERVHYDFATHRGRFATRPSVLTQQFRAEGELAFREEGGSVVVRLEGAAHAKLSLLSSRAERQAVRSAEEQHAALAQAVRGRLAGIDVHDAPPL